MGTFPSSTNTQSGHFTHTHARIQKEFCSSRQNHNKLIEPEENGTGLRSQSCFGVRKQKKRKESADGVGSLITRGQRRCYYTGDGEGVKDNGENRSGGWDGVLCFHTARD